MGKPKQRREKQVPLDPLQALRCGIENLPVTVGVASADEVAMADKLLRFMLHLRSGLILDRESFELIRAISEGHGTSAQGRALRKLYAKNKQYAKNRLFKEHVTKKDLKTPGLRGLKLPSTTEMEIDKSTEFIVEPGTSFNWGEIHLHNGGPAAVHVRIRESLWTLSDLDARR